MSTFLHSKVNCKVLGKMNLSACARKCTVLLYKDNDGETVKITAKGIKLRIYRNV
jgi:hypothetical protein